MLGNRSERTRNNHEGGCHKRSHDPRFHHPHPVSSTEIEGNSQRDLPVTLTRYCHRIMSITGLFSRYAEVNEKSLEPHAQRGMLMFAIRAARHLQRGGAIHKAKWGICSGCAIRATLGG